MVRLRRNIYLSGMETYSVIEASKKLGISTRAVQKRCLKDNVRKKSNRYLITNEHIEKWFADIKSNEPTNEPTNERSQNGTQQNINAFEKYTIEEIEDFDFNFDGKEGNLVFVPKDKVYAEYTNEEYSFLEARLNEWHTLQKDLDHKEELFDVEKKSLKELLKHYKTQWKYQKKQSTKILDMHQTLIDTIQKQSNLAIQRQVIEAIEKDVINKDWKPKK